MKEVVVMFMFVLMFFAFVGCLCWFFEETNIGKKYAEKIINKIMKGR